MAVPYTFGTATAAIPLSNLDSNFDTPITLGNTAIQLGNTVTTLNNMTLANTTVSSVSTAITVAQGGTGLTSTPANGALDIGNGTGFTRTTLTAGSGISITNGAGSISIATSGATATSISNGTSNVSIATSGGSVTAFTNGTSALTIDTSQNLKFNSGYGSVATAYGCRAWVNFNGTGTVAIRGSGNVSSITDIGTGQYGVNLTTAVPDTNYAIQATVKPDTDRLAGCGEYYNFTRTTSAFAISSGDNTTYYDAAFLSATLYR